MTTDTFRALCAELVEKLDDLNCHYNIPSQSALVDRAHTLLTQPEPEGLTDEELHAVARAAEVRSMREQGGLGASDANGIAAQLQVQRLAGLRAAIAADRARRPAPQPEPEGLELTDEELVELERVARDLQWCARGWEPKAMLVGNVRASEIEELCSAFLARWGHPTPQPPADGEVAELVAWLRLNAEEYASDGCPNSADHFTRAAELLQRQHPQPVPVAERPPGPKDCLDEGWAWFFSPRVGWRQAVLPVSPAYTHWLPFHALPLPTSEEASSGD